MGRPKGSKNKITEMPVIEQEIVQEKPVIKEQPKPEVRRYSDNKDHKGEGHPLCFNCGHRDDMHYTERRQVLQKVGKNFLNEVITYEELIRSKDYSGARPCNHACLCTQFE